MEEFTFSIPNKDVTCNVYIGENLFQEVASYCSREKISTAVIITDDKVGSIYASKLSGNIKEKGIRCITLSFPNGEQSKNRETKEMLEDKMLEHGIDRDACIIALGGGVTGDIAGFVAATYMRGIPFIQVPTTIMALADSSYGGKTGIDTPKGKNLIGVFHQPKAVFMDLSTLKTLDDEIYREGFIELIKHGLIRDKGLYDLVKSNIDIILSRKGSSYRKVMKQLLSRNIKVKRDVVIADQKESNLRKILNCGHTVGHAIEKLSSYRILHGLAVAKGLAVEAYISLRQGLLKKEDYEEIIATLKAFGMELEIPLSIKTEDIIETMKLDKKAKNGMPEFCLLESIGNIAKFEDGNYVKALDLTFVKETIDEHRNQDADEDVQIKQYKICGCITENNSDACIEIMNTFDADMFEHRIDYMDANNEFKRLHDVASSLGKPLIATVRNEKDKGHFNGSEKKRAEILVNAIEAGYNYVDIELEMDDELRQKVISKAKDNGIKVIISTHNFEKTPEKKILINKLHQIKDLGADIGKIVTMSNDEKDNKLVLEIIDEANKIDLPIVAFCMGEKGKSTRIECLKRGSSFTYASINKESAPGQLSIKEIRRLL